MTRKLKSLIGQTIKEIEAISGGDCDELYALSELRNYLKTKITGLRAESGIADSDHV